MDTAELRQTLELHRTHGARFRSFFMESHWKSDGSSTDHNQFPLDPENPKSGSDVLFQSLKTVATEN